MKKYILSLVALFATMSINAQVVKVYKNGTLQDTYTNTTTDKYKVVFEKATPAPTVDANLLPGVFTVAEGKTVQFTKSNLYWDGSAYKFEANQTDYPTSWNANHVGHFSWNTPADVAAGKYPYALTYAYSSRSTEDKFFCGEDNKITVEGTTDLFALSDGEWKYIIYERDDNLIKDYVKVSNNGITYTNCFIIAPDGFSGTLKSSYTLDEVNSLGLVCLPNAGYRYNSTVTDAPYGKYYTSSPGYGFNEENLAGHFYFDDGELGVDYHDRNYGYPLRLVK